MGAGESLALVLALGGLASLLTEPARTGWGRPSLGPAAAGEFPATGAALCVALGAWIVASAALGFAGARGVTAVLLAGLVSALIAAALWRRATAGTLRPVFPPVRRVLAGLERGLVTFGLVALAGFALQRIYELLEVQPPGQPLIDVISGAAPLGRAALAVAALVLAPFAEEVFFRGLLLPVCARRLGFTLGNWTQALVFGLSHFLFDPAKWPLALVLAIVGATCGHAYRRTGSLLVAIVIHGTFNALQLAVLFVGLAGQ